MWLGWCGDAQLGGSEDGVGNMSRCGQWHRLHPAPGKRNHSTKATDDIGVMTLESCFSAQTVKKSLGQMLGMLDPAWHPNPLSTSAVRHVFIRQLAWLLFFLEHPGISVFHSLLSLIFFRTTSTHSPPSLHPHENTLPTLAGACRRTCDQQWLRSRIPARRRMSRASQTSQ